MRQIAFSGIFGIKGNEGQDYLQKAFWPSEMVIL